MAKKYYWLKLHNNFFQTKEIKRLRRIAGGDTFTVIYLKMMLKTLVTDGRLYYDGFEDNFVSELAMDIDEDEQNVEITVQYLMRYGLLQMVDENEYIVPQAANSIGSETAVAARVRKHRQKEKALQCNTIETQLKQSCNVEIEKEKYIELDRDIELDREKELDGEKEEKPPSIQQLVTAYLQNGFGQPSALTIDMLKADSEEYGVDWCLAAIKIAVLKNVHSWTYCRGILKSWHTKYDISAKPWEIETANRKRSQSNSDIDALIAKYEEEDAIANERTKQSDDGEDGQNSTGYVFERI